MLKIHINRVPGSLNNEIFIFDEQKSVTTGFVFREDGECIATTQVYKPGEAWIIKPAMRIPEQMTRDLIQAFVEYAKERNYPVSEDATKGKLEATEKHLEDMRTLVFKKNETN